MGEVELCNDGLVLGLVDGGLKPKYECILDVYSLWGGHNLPGTAPLSIGGPVYGQFLNGEVGRFSRILNKLGRGELHDEVCQDLPFDCVFWFIFDVELAQL